MALMALKKILVVEEDSSVAELTQKQLELVGVTSSATTSGPKALEKAQKEKPDLILLNILLPGMSGLEVARGLKANLLTCFIPILAVTGKTMPGDREKCLESGWDGYLAKPFIFQQLKREIEKLLR